MEIKVAFFKGQGAWHNKIVRQYTSSKYSHAELILPDGKSSLSITPFGRQGVRLAEFDYDEEWDFISIEIEISKIPLVPLKSVKFKSYE